ncbi:MAG TPA: hypothetical protein VHW43_13245, partial [Puia sp.]|nr:hypothetical protein [Puia sp.]
AAPSQTVTIGNDKIVLVLDYGDRACITSMTINGQRVMGAADGAFTTVRVGDKTYSSLQLLSKPVLRQTDDSVTLAGIVYGDQELMFREKWTFITAGRSITWKIERRCSRPVRVEGCETPKFNFDSIDTWDGAYQGYGGLAWFYLFNERLCTYGVHTRASSFWNSKTGNGLDVIVEAPGKQVAMRYTRTKDDRLAYGVTVSGQEMLPRYDSGTNRRRFIRGRTDVWAPFELAAGKRTAAITLGYFDVNERYGRGTFAGIDGSRVSAVLNTIARIGVIDSLHFGGNSWHTPYGPICLHEQYIAQLGLAIDDPHYLKGYQSCLDFYRDHAIKPDGRVFARWAYTDEDRAPGQGNKEGFYEAQWGILMDANPDFVTNVAELYDLTGDRHWVMGHRRTCEKALDWILKRDSNGNGLVEMMTDNEGQKRGSDWIDIIWASYENAFVNAKLYHALVEWAAVERQLNNPAKAGYYEAFAGKLKTSFNKSTKDGGFWDEEKQCYIHWRDKDGSLHGRNMVTPVNFMAIAYGICDDERRSKGILETIETQMEREKLFFWPLCMNSYAPGEGNDWQFPFPNYENGDLFLSWGSVAVKAYAQYRPDLALKYIRNVLDQYGKDGLAFQRYGRAHQEGLGDDILSGNSLAIVGLYQAIYGINPRYNRFYLEPHITPELAGTELKYYFRGEKLSIVLNPGNYVVGDRTFKIASAGNFGFSHSRDSLFYFSGSSAAPSLQVISGTPLQLSVIDWQPDTKEWTLSLSEEASHPVQLVVRQLEPNTGFLFSVNGKLVKKVRSNGAGEVRLPGYGTARFALRLEK